jgi:hypothetical protein
VTDHVTAEAKSPEDAAAQARRIRRTALLLGLVAVAFYATFIAVTISHQ